MKNLFNIGLIAQFVVVILYLIHKFTYTALGSDFMFGVFIVSLIVGIYLLWQSFGNPDIVGFRKTLGIILGILPLLFIIAMVLFVTNFRN